MRLIDIVAYQAVIGIMIVVLAFWGRQMRLLGRNFLPLPARYVVIALRCPTLDAQILILTQADLVMKQFKNKGWKFYEKMEQILPSGSNAHGAAAYNPASLAAEVPVGGASTSNTAADNSFDLSRLPLARVTSHAPASVAGPSSESASTTMNMDASLSQTSSGMGKRSYSDVVTSHSVPPSIISN